MWYVLVDKYEETNLASYSYVVRRGWTVLLAFLDNCGYSLIPHQKFTVVGLLKINWKMESETVSRSIPYSDTLKHIGLSLNDPGMILEQIC